MTRKVVTRGLPLLLALLLVGGCSCNPCNEPNPCNQPCPSPCPEPCAPPPCDPVVEPCSAPCDPDRNVCNWPEYPPARTATQILDTIDQLVDAAESQQQIDPALVGQLKAQITRCRDPNLANPSGRHVCHLQNPLPGVELHEIEQHAADLGYPADLVTGKAATPLGHWGTILQELQNFPSGN